jgi:hypothetical protein
MKKSFIDNALHMHGIVFYVPRKEDGTMDEAKETTRLELWESIHSNHEAIDSESLGIFYPEHLGFECAEVKIVALI